MVGIRGQLRIEHDMEIIFAVACWRPHPIGGEHQRPQTYEGEIGRLRVVLPRRVGCEVEIPYAWSLPGGLELVGGHEAAAVEAMKCTAVGGVGVGGFFGDLLTAAREGAGRCCWRSIGAGEMIRGFYGGCACGLANGE